MVGTLADKHSETMAEPPRIDSMRGDSSGIAHDLRQLRSEVFITCVEDPLSDDVKSRIIRIDNKRDAKAPMVDILSRLAQPGAKFACMDLLGRFFFSTFSTFLD